MSSIVVEIKDEVSGFMNKLAASMPQILKEGVLLAAEFATGEIRREVLATFKGRTGNLARSFKTTFIGWDSEGVSAGGLSDSSYAYIQDQGGTIKPKSGRALAVPFPGANIPAGKWPRDFAKGELVFIKRKGKPPLLVRERKNKKGIVKKIEPLFILKTSVTLRGKNYVEKAKESAIPMATKIMKERIEKATKKGGTNG